MAAKLASDVMLTERESKVIGTVSVLPHEGKSVFLKEFCISPGSPWKKNLAHRCGSPASQAHLRSGANGFQGNCGGGLIQGFH